MPFLLLLAVVLGSPSAAQPASPGHRPTWDQLAPVHAQLTGHGLTAATLDRFLERTHVDNLARVREGDLDHLVFYALQSTHFTKRPPIEPALSAKALVDGLYPESRAALLDGPRIPPVPIPSGVAARIRDLLVHLEQPSRDERLAYFRDLVHTAFPAVRDREPALGREYLRAMRFVYRKEFVAQRSARASDAVADLYRTRGLSTDTGIEAGFVVYNGLGVLKALEPGRRIRRVLIVGPGLDLAPRTGLSESGPPQSYQPWAVMDALISLGLSSVDDLEIVGADINPRVVDHLRRARAVAPVLHLLSGVRESATVSLAEDYRSYLSRLGRSIGEVKPVPGEPLATAVRIAAPAARALDGVPLDIVTERLAGPGFDLVIATNILPYFDDVQLALAMSNVAAMLVPGGVFLHNEPRPVLGEITAALDLPFEQARHVTIATVHGAPAPLADSIWLHRKVAAPRARQRGFAQ